MYWGGGQGAVQCLKILIETLGFPSSLAVRRERHWEHIDVLETPTAARSTTPQGPRAGLHARVSLLGARSIHGHEGLFVF